MKTSLCPALVAFSLAMALAGCGSGSNTAGRTSPPAAPTPEVSPTDTVASSAPTPTTAPTGSASTCPLKPGGADLIDWNRAPGVLDGAILLGSVDLFHCKPTVDTYASMQPTSAGFCSILATASANPGYNVDASPARRPLHGVLVEVGPAC
jgi:hypothetical protein